MSFHRRSSFLQQEIARRRAEINIISSERRLMHLFRLNRGMNPDYDKRRYKPTLTTPQPAIMAVMGTALWLCNIPNTVEVMAAIVN
jgi:hypothetical protein